MREPFFDRAFWRAFATLFVWINVSENLRYFLLVKPLVRSDFAMVPGIVPSSAGIGALWVVWELVLILMSTIIFRLVIERFGRGLVVAFLAGTVVWATVFLLLWLGVHNMGLATPRILATALPLAWFELLVAAFLVRWALGPAPAREVHEQAAGLISRPRAVRERA